MDKTYITKVKNYLEEADKISKELNLDIDMDHPLRMSRVMHDVRVETHMHLAGLNRQKQLDLIKQNPLDFYSKNQLSQFEIDEYKAILKAFVDWRFAALEIYPGIGTFLQSVVAAEPLYIADWSQTVIDHVSAQFNPFYAERRLMKYPIELNDFSSLPHNAFGLVYNLNWAKFESLDNLTLVAKQVYDMLLPGGLYLFNYNPIDQWHGANAFYWHRAYGADTDKLIDNLKSIGYIVHKCNRQTTHSYIICGRDGELPNYKLEPILARIIEKTEPFV